jgi:hypothetical protein
MNISQIIEMLESELTENGDGEMLIYNSYGQLIKPTSIHQDIILAKDYDRWLNVRVFSEKE